MAYKKFHIIIVPQSDSEIKNYCVSYPLLALLLSFSLVGLGVVGFLVFNYFYYSIDKHELLRLKAANSAISHRLKVVNKAFKEIKDEMARYAELDDKMRQLGAMDRIDPDVRSAGIGGPVLSNNTDDLEEVSPEIRRTLEKVSLEADELLRRSRIQRQSFIEIINNMEKNKDQLDHTPSISPIRFHIPGTPKFGQYSGWLSSGFGKRRDPFTGRLQFHDGIDISAWYGTPIHAPADGRVERVLPNNRALGNMIIIDHGYGIKTKYGHMSNFNVKKGQKVKRWDIIGWVGNTGKSTGYHLHYSVYKNNTPQNPLMYILPETPVPEK